VAQAFQPVPFLLSLLVSKLRLGTPLAAKLLLRLTRAAVQEVKNQELFLQLGSQPEAWKPDKIR
jgi:hypothetical protein